MHLHLFYHEHLAIPGVSVDNTYPNYLNISMRIHSNREILERHDETRLRFLRSRLGDIGVHSALEMRNIELDTMQNLSEDEADAYFATLDETVPVDPLLEAELAFAQRVSDLWVPLYGYSIVRASPSTGVLLERRLGRSAASFGMFHNVERLAAVLEDDHLILTSKVLHGVDANGDVFDKPRQIGPSDRIAVFLAPEQLNEIDELIDVELDIK
jgi:hypothetical protein